MQASGAAGSRLQPARKSGRARYRVWQATRRTFRWPENWQEPDLRDDKAHLRLLITAGAAIAFLAVRSTTVRRSVRDLLERTDAWKRLDPTDRRVINQ